MQFGLQPTAWRFLYPEKRIGLLLRSLETWEMRVSQVTFRVAAPIIQLASLVGGYPKHTAYAGFWLPIILLSGFRLVWLTCSLVHTAYLGALIRENHITDSSISKCPLLSPSISQRLKWPTWTIKEKVLAARFACPRAVVIVWHSMLGRSGSHPL